MPNKKTIIYVLVALVIILGAYLLFRPDSAAQMPTAENAILFTRYDCPHCQKVEAYITENKVTDKIKIIQKEIHDTDNAKELVIKAKSCGLLETEIGVPLLYDDQKCYLGDQDIINHFIEKMQ